MTGAIIAAGELEALKREKRRLSEKLQVMLRMTEGRSFTDEERAEWEDVYQRWSMVTEEVTAEVQLVSAREAYDRRRQGQRKSERRKQHVAIEIPEDRRSSEERREIDRRSGSDRRDPFKDHAAGKFPKIESKD